jgi:hypothetical protein
MNPDKSANAELVWLYSRRQASLLVTERNAETFLAAGEYHTEPLLCPCLNAAMCACFCHVHERHRAANPDETPAL